MKTNMWTQEDVEINYVFEIPPTKQILSDEEVERLIRKLKYFHKDYSNLSKKFRIAEIFTDEYLEANNKTIEGYFANFGEDMVFHTVRFFPRSGFKEAAMFASDCFYYDKNSTIINNYVYGMYSTRDKKTHFCTLDYLKKHSELPEKGIELDTSSFLGYCLGDYFMEPIGFSVSILSNLYFPFLNNDLNQKVIDNQELAYLNAARFNSYLRDLKDLFVNKYGWTFRFEYDQYSLEIIEFLTEDGIEINGEIVYEEDRNNKNFK